MSDEQQVRNHNKKYHDLNDKQYDYFEKLMGQKMSDWPEALRDAALPFRCGDELACNVADWVKEEMASNELKQLLADKEMTIGVLDTAIKAKDEVHKEDMAAAEEQLAEMQELLDWLNWHHSAHHAHFEERDKGREYSETENNRNLRRIDEIVAKALSAAPKREVQELRIRIMALENDQRELRRWLGAMEMTIEAIKKRRHNG